MVFGPEVKRGKPFPDIFLKACEKAGEKADNCLVLEDSEAKEIMEYIKINDRSFFRRHYLNPMIKTGQLKMTIPDKPKSGNQKYYV